VGVAALCWWSQQPESRDLQYAIQDALAKAVGALRDAALRAVLVSSIGVLSLIERLFCRSGCGFGCSDGA
jgi:hypothetical protein